MLDDFDPCENLSIRVCVYQRWYGLGILMYYNWECRIYSEFDVCRVNEFRGVSWQWMSDNHVDKMKLGVWKEMRVWESEAEYTKLG